MYKCPQCNATAEVAGECQTCKVQMAEVQPEQAAPEAGEASPATENDSPAV